MRRLHPVLPFVLLLALAGCGTIDTLKSLVGLGPARTDLDAVQVIAEAGANRDLPTRLDLVFVFDTGLSAQLPKTGPAWFQQKDALLAAWPGKLQALSLEVPPLSEAAPALPKGYGKAVAVFAYADYLAAAGQPVINLTPFENARITLRPEAIAIAEAP